MIYTSWWWTYLVKVIRLKNSTSADAYTRRGLHLDIHAAKKDVLARRNCRSLVGT